MSQTFRLRMVVLVAGLLLFSVACANPGEDTAVTAVPPTPTNEPTPEVQNNNAPNFVVIATDAPNAPFTQFDEFGEVDGFEASLLQYITDDAQLDYELIVTPFEGVLNNIAANSNRDFDALMAHLTIPEQPQEGIVYSEPYMEVGQVLVVLADEQGIQSHNDLQSGMAVGVVANSQAEQLAQNELMIAPEDLRNDFQSEIGVLQALLDEELRAVIVDSYIADYFTQALPEQLKRANGDARSSWISSKSYAIALSANDPALLNQLNTAIANVKNAGHVERLTTAWLIPPDTLNPGEPRVSTRPNEFAIGIVGELADMDPASLTPDLINWEVKSNTMSGLYMFNANNELVPILASGLPTISEDKLEYTISLRRGLSFPDGREFTAEDVKWSIERGRSLGNFLINGYLKDADENNFADDDAVQIIDPNTVKLVLQEPTSYFATILATPPYFPISSDCYADTWDYESVCGGIGPYLIDSWEMGTEMQLRVNPGWPGAPAPAFENITLRFYEDADNLQRSLEEFGSIDLAWTGLPYTDFVTMGEADADGNGRSDFTQWTGPANFKSYIVFNQAVEPWTSEKVRQAASLTLDRTALANTVFATSRQPLLSPIPNEIPGYLATLPEQNIAQAQALLLEEGFNASTPLPIELSFVNDGRYSELEEAYANAIKAQLEETGVFQVTVTGAPWDIFSGQLAGCNNSASLLGWPSPGRPTNYLDASAWTDFFITSSAFCPNYESEKMTELLQKSREELDPAARAAILAEMQILWAKELPTLDILQQPRIALSQNSVENVTVDAMGLLHYELLAKGGQ